MSERALLAMSDDEVVAFLGEQRRGHVGTINADGTPHVVPLSYVVIDGRVTFWTDPRSRKVVNLRRDPRMTCLVEAGSEFAEFRAVQVSGRGELSESLGASARVGLALFERAAGELTDQLRDVAAQMAPERIGITLHPERVVTWDHRKLPGVNATDIGR